MGFRTDLALEAAEALSDDERLRLEGFGGAARQATKAGRLRIHRVTVPDGIVAKTLGKAPGEYITVTAPAFSGAEELSDGELCAIAREIALLLPARGLVLVVGLGNNDITPDAVGPRTVRQVLATRHISGEYAQKSGFDSLRPTAAIAPGVLGQTGMETAEVIRSLAGTLKPAAVVAVDALAARSAARLGNTIQISNGGISPGSGVMNSRAEISEPTLGVPVVSIGVPTVVDASTLAADLLKCAEPEDDKRGLFEPEGAAMMITPREIDVLVGRAAKTLSLCINKALQPDLTLEELTYLVG